MSIDSEPKFNFDLEKPNERVLHIEIDEIPDIEKLVTGIRLLPIEEQLIGVSLFIKSKFKNALSPHNKNLPQEEKDKIQQVLTQEPKKLSEALCLGYGVCVEYHVLGKSIFDKLGIPCKFQTGWVPGGPGHTFLDIQVGGKWQIFDPYAEVYLSDAGRPDLKLLTPGYYDSSESKI